MTGDRTEPSNTPACISRGVNITLSTETLIFVFGRSELIIFVMLAENCNFDNLGKKPGCHRISKVSSYPTIPEQQICCYWDLMSRDP